MVIFTGELLVSGRVRQALILALKPTIRNRDLKAIGLQSLTLWRTTWNSDSPKIELFFWKRIHAESPVGTGFFLPHFCCLIFRCYLFFFFRSQLWSVCSIFQHFEGVPCFFFAACKIGGTTPGIVSSAGSDLQAIIFPTSLDLRESQLQKWRWKVDHEKTRSLESLRFSRFWTMNPWEFKGPTLPNATEKPPLEVAGLMIRGYEPSWSSMPKRKRWSHPWVFHHFKPPTGNAHGHGAGHRCFGEAVAFLVVVVGFYRGVGGWGPHGTVHFFSKVESDLGVSNKMDGL